MSDSVRHPNDQELLLLAQGELSSERTEALSVYLGKCQECRQRYRVWGDIHRQLSRLPLPEIPEAVDARVAERLSQGKQASKKRRMPAFSLKAAAAAILLLLMATAPLLWLHYYGALSRTKVSGPQLSRVEPPSPYAVPQVPAPKDEIEATETAIVEVPALAARRDRHIDRPPTPAAIEEPISVPAKAGQSVGVFRAIQGQPLIVHGQTTQVATVNTRIAPGDEILTGESDRALIRLPDNGKIVVGFDSAVYISAVTQQKKASDVTMELRHGSVWAWSPGDGGKIRIRSQRGNSRVYRGEALVRHYLPQRVPTQRSEDVTEVLAFRGQVSFSNPQGDVVEIPSGHAIRVHQQDEIPSPEEFALSRILRVSSVWGTRYEVWQIRSLSAEDLLMQLDAPRLFLGVKVRVIPYPHQGLQVASIEPGSSAEQAGVQIGDNVLRIGELPLTTPADVAAAELLLAEQREVDLAIERDSHLLTLRLPHTVTAPRLCDSANARLSTVASAIARNDIEQAVQECVQITQEQPTCASAWFNLGLLREYEKRYDEALMLYKKAIEMMPESAELHLALGRVYARIGNGRRAVTVLEESVSINSVGFGHYLLGKVLLLDGRLARAEQQIVFLLASSSAEDRGWGQLLAGQITYIVDNNFPQAARHFEEASLLDPANLQATFYLAAANLAMGNADRAKELLELVLRGQPDSVRATNLMGMIPYGEQEWDEAAHWFQQARLLNPISPILPFNLGNVALDAGNPTKAIANYRDALGLSDSFVLAHVNLGEALEAVGNWEMAVVHYRKALELDPGSKEALDQVVALWEKRGQTQRAQQLALRYGLMGTSPG